MAVTNYFVSSWIDNDEYPSHICCCLKFSCYTSKLKLYQLRCRTIFWLCSMIIHRCSHFHFYESEINWKLWTQLFQHENHNSVWICGPFENSAFTEELFFSWLNLLARARWKLGCIVLGKQEEDFFNLSRQD